MFLVSFIFLAIYYIIGIVYYIDTNKDKVNFDY